MIQINARINLLNDDAQVSSNVISQNNLAVPMPTNRISKGNNAWVIGFSKIGDNATLEDSVQNGGSVDYYMGNESLLTFTISKPVDNATIVFDTARDIYPTEIDFQGFNKGTLVVNETYYLDDAIFTLKLDKLIDKFTILPKKMNKNFPLVIQGVYVGLKINIDNHNLKDLSIYHKDRTEENKPDFGIISNKGNLEFIDTNGEIKDYIEDELLDENQEVIISLVDTNSNKSTIIGKYLTSEWKYDNNNRVVEVQLKDDLLQWQNILVNSVNLQKQKVTLKTYYDYLVSQTPNTFNLIPTQAVIDILNSISLEYYYVDKGNLWNEWQKLCEIAGLYIYKDYDNNVVVSNAFANEITQKIVIPSNSIYNMDNDKILRNKIRGIDYDENQTEFVLYEKESVLDTRISAYGLENNTESKNKLSQAYQYINKSTNQTINTWGNPKIEITYAKGQLAILKSSKDNKQQISKLYSGSDIIYSLVGTKAEGTVGTTFRGEQPAYNETEKGSFEGTITKFKVTSNIYNRYTQQLLGTFSIDLPNNTSFSITEDTNNFYVNFNVPINQKYDDKVKEFNLNTQETSYYGKYTEIQAKYIKFNIYGDIYKFEFDSKKISVGDEINYSLENNEFLQQNTKINLPSGVVTIGNYLSNKIIDSYKKGKENAVLLCQIGDYYDENKNLVISSKDLSKPSMFRINDMVIPYIYTPKGQNIPMSLYKNRQPKIFKVIGVEFIYDGAVWQKLTLLET